MTVRDFEYYIEVITLMASQPILWALVGGFCIAARTLQLPFAVILAASTLASGVAFEIHSSQGIFEIGDGLFESTVSAFIVAVVMTCVVHFMFPRQPANNEKQAVEKEKPVIKTNQEYEELSGHWRRVQSENTDKEFERLVIEDDQLGHVDIKSDARQPSPLRLPLIIFGWPVIFALYVWLAEPYGYRIDRYEKQEMWIVFGVGWPIWGVITLFFTGAKIFRPIYTASDVTAKAVKAGTKRKITEIQTAEINEYLEILKGADDEELGIAIASALHVAAKYKDETGVDLFQPQSALQEQPTIVFELTRKIEMAQAAGEMHMSTPLLVWAHSLRGFSNPPLRRLAREMWQELSRGMPHAESAAMDARLIYGETLRIDRLGDFPEGLSPKHPKQTKVTASTNTESELARLNDLHTRGLITDETLSVMQQELLRNR